VFIISLNTMSLFYTLFTRVADPDPILFGFGSIRAKITHKRRKNLKLFLSN